MKVSKLQPPAKQREEFDHAGKRFVPSASGCYALTNYSGDIFYIGQSKNLAARMRQHLEDDEKTQRSALGVAYWFWFTLCAESDLGRIERGWINQFEMRNGGELPVFNRNHPSS
jgi:excinuclease UvrABC nuclease subunit